MDICPLNAIAPLQPPDPVQLVAFVTDQVSVELAPLATDPGAALSVMPGGGGATLIVMDCVVEPPEPVHVSENDVPLVSGAVDCEPLSDMEPLQPPAAAQLDAPVLLQLSVVVAPLAIEAGFALSVTCGALPVVVTVFASGTTPTPPQPDSSASASMPDTRREPECAQWTATRTADRAKRGSVAALQSILLSIRGRSALLITQTTPAANRPWTSPGYLRCSEPVGAIIPGPREFAKMSPTAHKAVRRPRPRPAQGQIKSNPILANSHGVALWARHRRTGATQTVDFSGPRPAPSSVPARIGGWRDYVTGRSGRGTRARATPGRKFPICDASRHARRRTLESVTMGVEPKAGWHCSVWLSSSHSHTSRGSWNIHRR